MDPTTMKHSTHTRPGGAIWFAVGLPLAYPIAAATRSAWIALASGLVMLIVMLLTFSLSFLLYDFTEHKHIRLSLPAILLVTGTILASVIAGLAVYLLSSHMAITLPPVLLTALVAMLQLILHITSVYEGLHQPTIHLRNIVLFCLTWITILVGVGMARELLFSGTVFSLSAGYSADRTSEGLQIATGWIIAGLTLAGLRGLLRQKDPETEAEERQIHV